MKLHRDTLEIINVVVIVCGMGKRGKCSDDEQEDEEEETERDSSR